MVTLTLNNTVKENNYTVQNRLVSTQCPTDWNRSDEQLLTVD